MWKAILLGATVPLASRFPAPFYGLAWVLGTLAWAIQRRGRARIIRNLAPAFDGHEGMARRASLQVFRNVARYYADMASLPGMDPATLEARALDIVHNERLEVLKGDRPVIIVSAHLGNPEIAVQALAERGRPFAALVEPLEPPTYARKLLQIRSSAGGRFYEATTMGVHSAMRDLREGAVLALIADRDIQGRGVCVEFMGRHVRMPRGPWVIARREGALVVPMFVERRNRMRFQLFVEDPFEVDAEPVTEDEAVCRAAAHWATLLEEYVRREPGQWTVTEDYWRVHACEPEEPHGRPCCAKEYA